MNTNSSRQQKSPVKKQNPRSKALKKHKRQMFVAVLVLFLTFYILVSLLFTGLFYLSFNKKPKSETIYPLYILNEESKTVATVPAETANIDYGRYIPFYTLDKLCNFSIMGDDEKITLILRKSNEYMELYRNSSHITLNGVPVRMNLPVIFTDDDYLIPLELIEEYMIGLTIKFNEKKNRYDIFYADSSQTLSLKLKAQVPSQQIPGDDISEDSSDNE